VDDLEQDMSPEDLMLSFVSAERGKVRPLSTPPLPHAMSMTDTTPYRASDGHRGSSVVSATAPCLEVLSHAATNAAIKSFAPKPYVQVC